MKIAFCINALTHYYNPILKRLSEQYPELDVFHPAEDSLTVGDGVRLNQKIDFRAYPLAEEKCLGKPWLKGLGDKLIQGRYDVCIVVVEYWRSIFLHPGEYLKIKKSGCKIIVKHIPFRLGLYNGKVLGLSLTLMKAWAERMTLSLADSSVCYVDPDVQYRKIKLTIPYTIIGNSPDTESLIPIIDKLPRAPESTTFRFVSVGRMVRSKNFELIVRAVELMKADGLAESYCVTIVGDGPDQNRLMSMVESKGLQKEIVFERGVYEPESLYRKLLDSDVAIMPGLGGLFLNDCLMASLPVLCSVGDGTEDVLITHGKTGLRFAENDETSLRHWMVFCLRNRALIRGMRRNCRSIIDTEMNVWTVINGYREGITSTAG